jgi:poly-gamma-glutamate synthesis protein (capsule biosynthesis protein)
MPTLLREAIDAGADIVTVTGPRTLRGIEVYQGRPIFYGLGSFFLQLADDRGPMSDTARAAGVDPLACTKPEFIARQFQLPEDWYDSVVAVSRFQGGRVAEVRLHPLVLERRPSPCLEGAPRPAPPAQAQRILERLRQDSLPWGTNLTLEDGVGVIRIDPHHPPPGLPATTAGRQ